MMESRDRRPLAEHIPAEEVQEPSSTEKRGRMKPWYNLPDENKGAVYNRMITERNNIAAAYQAQGESEAQKIRNLTDKETAVMHSEANAKAAQLEAEGEAEYMKILSDAYNDPDKAEYYLFVRQLDAAKKSLKDGNTTLFLDSDSPLAEVFTSMAND